MVVHVDAVAHDGLEGAVFEDDIGGFGDDNEQASAIVWTWGCIAGGLGEGFEGCVAQVTFFERPVEYGDVLAVGNFVFSDLIGAQGNGMAGQLVGLSFLGK